MKLSKDGNALIVRVEFRNGSEYLMVDNCYVKVDSNCNSWNGPFGYDVLLRLRGCLDDKANQIKDWDY